MPTNGNAEPPVATNLAKTGIVGLDSVLTGGLARSHTYLIEGVPGSGKTTLAMQFLIEGRRLGETVLYVTLSETADELRNVAASHGWSLDGVHMRELLPEENLLDGDQYTMFHPSEVELAATTKTILEEVDRLKPSRVVFDSLSELRLMAGNSLRYRRQILALKQFFAERHCTMLLLDDMTTDRDLHVQSVAHCVIQLQHLSPEFGAEHRRLRVVKYRATKFRGGYHDYTIVKGGLLVFPRLVASDHRGPSQTGRLATGIHELDDLIGGGLEEGTSTLVVGAAGTGKSTIAAQIVSSAAGRGQRATMFVFDENPNTLFSRCEGLGIPLRGDVEKGLVEVVQVDPAEFSPGELSHRICGAVEQRGNSIIVIDSLNGYLNSMPEERFLASQLHELLMYLNQRNVATILIGAHQGLIGAAMNTPIDASYLADTVILLRYFEARGEVRQAISVMKKRGSQHERTIREFAMNGRLHVGEALREFRGVLTGVPVYEGTKGPLFKDTDK
jgi:circadian clock protein KaiC